MRDNRMSRGGYTLMELLCTMALLGTFAAIATRVFSSTFKVMRQNGLGTEAAIRFDSAVSVLRNDVSAAGSVELPNGQSITIGSAEGKKIHWGFDRERGMWREDGSSRRSWNCDQEIEFRKEGSLVLIHPKESADDRGDVALAEKGNP